MASKSNVACEVLLRGLQSCGQSVDEQVQVWQDAYDFMGLSVTLGVGEENGRGAFTFDGTDIEQAKAFMSEVRQQFPLGRFEEERAMIESCLDKYSRAKTT